MNKWATVWIVLGMGISFWTSSLPTYDKSLAWGIIGFGICYLFTGFCFGRIYERKNR